MRDHTVGLTPMTVRMRAVALAVCALLASLAGSTAASAQPPATTLPINDRISDVLVDGAHDLVFVSSGTGQSALVVLDYAGDVVTTISIAGASGMALVGSTLYVAAADADEISVVDTAASPPTVTGALSIGSFTHPGSLAFVGGRLWFTVGVCGSGTVEHVRMDTDGTNLSTGKTLAASSCPRYATDPVDPNLLVMFDEGISPVTWSLYDMSTAPVTLLRDMTDPDSANGREAVFAPGGGSIFTASGSPYGFSQWKTADLTLMRSYVADAYPTAVDVTSTGGGRLAGGSDTPNGNSVWTYDLGTTTATWSWDMPNDDSVLPRGLAWSDDGQRLFAIGGAWQGFPSPVRFYVLDPLETPTTVSLSATPASLSIGDPVSLDGTLVFGDASGTAGQTVSLTRTDAGGTVPVADAVVAVDGTFHLDDVPPIAGQVTYAASFAGIEHHPGASASDVVHVAKLPVKVSVSVSAKTVTIGGSVTVKGHLGIGTESRVLEIVAKPDGGGEQLLKKGTVDARGNLSVKVSPTRDTTFIARYAGDATHVAAQDKATTRVRVILAAKLTKYVSTSGAYRIYRAGTYAHVDVHVSPNHAGSSVKATLQGYTGSAWKTLDTGTFRLDASSDTTFVIKGTSNVNFRVRVLLPTHTDHIGDASPWLYLRFT